MEVWTSQSEYGGAVGLLKSDASQAIEHVNLRLLDVTTLYLLPGTLVTFPLEAGFSRSGVAALVV